MSEFLNQMIRQAGPDKSTMTDVEEGRLHALLKRNLTTRELAPGQAEQILREIGQAHEDGRVLLTKSNFSLYESWREYQRTGKMSDIYIDDAAKAAEKQNPDAADSLQSEKTFLDKRRREEKEFTDERHREVAKQIVDEQAAIADANLRLKREEEEAAELKGVIG